MIEVLYPIWYYLSGVCLILGIINFIIGKTDKSSNWFLLAILDLILSIIELPNSI